MSNIIDLEQYKPQFYNERRCQVLCNECGSRAWRIIAQNEDDTTLKVECFNCGVYIEGLEVHSEGE